MANKITVCFTEKLEAALQDENMSSGLDKIGRLLISIETFWLGRSAFHYWPNDAMGHYFDLQSPDSIKLLSHLRRSSRVTINLTLGKDEQTLRYEHISARVRFHDRVKNRFGDPEIVFLLRGNDGSVRRISPNGAFNVPNQ